MADSKPTTVIETPEAHSGELSSSDVCAQLHALRRGLEEQMNLLRRDVNNRMGNLESEVTQLHLRFDDTPPGLQLSKWAASQAEVAVIGTAELDRKLREGFAGARASNRLAVALITAVSVVAVALVTGISTNWPSLREKQVRETMRLQWDDYKTELAAREQTQCARCQREYGLTITK